MSRSVWVVTDCLGRRCKIYPFLEDTPDGPNLPSAWPTSALRWLRQSTDQPVALRRWAKNLVHIIREVLDGR